MSLSHAPIDGMDDGLTDQPDPLADDIRAEDLENGNIELVEERWREMLRIDPEALNEQFYRISSEIAYLAAVHAKFIGLHLRAKARTKRLLGLLRLRAREELAAMGSAKPNESVVDARVEQMREYQQAQADEFEADVRRETAKGRVLGALAKKDMLVQLGANRRAELERDPVIRDRMRAIREGGYGHDGS